PNMATVMHRCRAIRPPSGSAPTADRPGRLAGANAGRPPRTAEPAHLRQGQSGMSYIEFLSQYSDRILSGTLVTIALTVLSALLAMAIALAAGLMRMAPNIILRGTAIVYIEIFRGTSLLVQLYWIFFVLPLF